jgi:hypothetical protein
VTYKDFLTGAVFTSADADLLMRQGVIVVSSAAARDAIASPTEGMRVYRLDTHMIETHDGSTWVPFDTGWINLVMSGTWATSGGAAQAAIRRLGSSVYLAGEVWAGVSGTQALLIPEGLRPKARTTVVVTRASNSVNTDQFVLSVGTTRDSIYIASAAGATVPPASPGIPLGALGWAV